MGNRKPSIYIVYTGGTIGMEKTPEGYKPKKGHLQKLMSEIKQFKAEDIPEYVIEELDPWVAGGPGVAGSPIGVVVTQHSNRLCERNLPADLHRSLSLVRHRLKRRSGPRQGRRPLRRIR